MDGRVKNQGNRAETMVVDWLHVATPGGLRSSRILLCIGEMGTIHGRIVSVER